MAGKATKGNIIQPAQLRQTSTDTDENEGESRHTPEAWGKGT